MLASIEGDLMCKGLPEDCMREFGREAARASFARVRTCTRANGEVRGLYIWIAASPHVHKTSTLLYLLIRFLAEGLLGALYAAFHGLPRMDASCKYENSCLFSAPELALQAL